MNGQLSPDWMIRSDLPESICITSFYYLLSFLIFFFLFPFGVDDQNRFYIRDSMRKFRKAVEVHVQMLFCHVKKPSD